VDDVASERESMMRLGRLIGFVALAAGAVWLVDAISDPVLLSRGACVVLCLTITGIALRPAIRALRRPDPWGLWRPVSYFGGFYALYFGIGPLPALWHTDAVLDQQALTSYPLACLLALVGLLLAQAGTRVDRGSSPLGLAVESQLSRRACVVALLVLVSIVWWERQELSDAGMFFKGSFVMGNLDLLDRTFVVAQRQLSFLTVAVASVLLYGYRGQRHYLESMLGWGAILGELGYYFLSSHRIPCLQVIGVLAMMRGALGRRTTLRALVVAGVLLAGVVYPVSSVMRQTFNDVTPWDKDVNNIASVSGVVLPEAIGQVRKRYADIFRSQSGEDFLSVRLNGVDMLASLVHEHVGRNRSLLHGEATWQGMLLLIPRALWPDKPEAEIDVERYVNYKFDLPQIDTMITPPAEFYADFGVVGIVLGMLAWGGLLGLLHRSTVVSTSMAGLLAYVTLMPSVAIPEQAFVSGVLGAVRTGVFVWGALWVVLAAVNKGRRRRVGRGHPRESVHELDPRHVATQEPEYV
jgi:hypothetical protein